MRYFLLIFAILFGSFLYGQSTDSIGQVKLQNCTIKKHKTHTEIVSGKKIQVSTYTILARTKVQTTCNYANPAKNEYETVDNKIQLSYAYDSSSVIYDTIMSGIRKYMMKQQEYAYTYLNGSSDFTHLPYLKSFIVNESVILPFISTLGERSSDYRIFYYNHQVYKIEGDCQGLGCLSSFMNQNMQLHSQGKELINGRYYLKNIDEVKTILLQLKK